MIDQIIQFLFSFLLFATPLVMSKSTSELFEFNKLLLIYASTVLIAFFWIFKMISSKKIILKKTVLDIPIVIFLASQIISTIFSMDRNTSLFGYYGRFNGGLASIICYVILYYAYVSNQVDIKKTLKAIIASSLIVILWAIPGHFGHDLTCWLFAGTFNNACWDNSSLAFRPELRAFSTLGQPNWLGAYLSVAFFIGIYFLVQRKGQVKNLPLQILLSAYLFLNFSMILFTRSRSAIGAVVIGLGLFLVYYWHFLKSDFKKVVLILLLVTIIPTLLFKTGEEKVDKFLTLATYEKIFIKKPSPISAPVKKVNTATSTNVTESFDIRKIVWQGAWDLALRYPLIGTGVETFAYSYGFVRPAAHNLTSEWDFVYNKAHNEYFNYLATTGFLGLGSYLLLIFVFKYYAIKKLNIKSQISKIFKNQKPFNQNITNEKPRGDEIIFVLCLSIAYLTILISNFFGFSTTTIQLLFYLIPAFIFVELDADREAGKSKLIFDSPIQWLAVFVFTGYSVYMLFSIAVYYLADVDYSYGVKYAKLANNQQAATYLQQAIKLRQEPVYEDKLSSSLAYLSALAALENQKDLAAQIASLANAYNQQNLRDYPQNVFYWKTKAKNMYYFYQITSDPKEILQGIDALETAKHLYPTDPKIPYTKALYYSVLYDGSKLNSDRDNYAKLSLAEIDKTITLKSNYQDAYLFKGQLLKKYGLKDEAKKVFEYILNNFNKNDPNALNELKNL